MKTLFYRLPDFLFYPASLVWSLFFGSIAGAIFNLVSVYENWLAINRLQLLLWKKYPQRSYHKYISNMWANQIKGKPIELAEYARLDLEKRYPEEPFPFLRILTNTVFMVFIAPFMALYGLLNGPAYVFNRLLRTRNTLQAEK